MARESDDLKSVLDHITTLVNKSKYNDVSVTTVNTSYRGRFLQRGNYFLLLANETRHTNLESGNKVHQIHYITISSIIGITIETDKEFQLPE